MNSPILYVVIPCYNEEEVLPETAKRLYIKLKEMMKSGVCAENSRILLVDDGSKDKTWQLIEKYHTESEVFSGIKLAHNRGHQNALLAGLMTAKNYCDCAVSMDADLQDDINVLDGFMEKFQEGCDVVYGVRSSRKSDTFFKRTTAEGFYKVMQKLGVDTIYNHADCRLMSKRALEALSEYKEVNLFLRGMVTHMGFKNDIVYFKRAERFAGESKYPLKKMLNFAWDGITSFSTKPLRLISVLGSVLIVLGVILLPLLLVLSLIGSIADWWMSTMNLLMYGISFVIGAMTILSGVIILCMGVVGEYIGKIYAESKARPRYAVDVFLNR